MTRRWERRSPIIIAVIFAVWYLFVGPTREAVGQFKTTIEVIDPFHAISEYR